MTPAFFPRDKYYCVLDDQPDFLVPAMEPPPVPDGEPLIVNPRCWLGWHAPLPPALARMAASHENLFDCPWIIWVDEPDRGALWPYWLGPHYAHLLAEVLPGDKLEASPEVIACLRTAGILTTEYEPDQRRASWMATAAWCASAFDAGYVQLSGLLPAFHVGALRRYYRYHTRMGTFTLGDEQTPGRYVAYDEPVTRYVHQQLARTVSDIVRRVVAPTYSYLALYQGGATLDPHTDREACQYTVSLCVDATPDPVTYGAWPLSLMTAEGPLQFLLGIGDALLFRGRELAHWRDRLPEGYTASSVLFHFADT